MNRRASFLLAALAALAVQQAALGSSGNPQRRLNPSDNQMARLALVGRDDLGVGEWKSLPSPAASASSCGIILRVQPSLSSLVETGAATGPVFVTSGSHALNQSVRVYATQGQANTAWGRTVNKTLVICMEQQVEATSTMGAPVSVTSWNTIKLPKLADRAAGFRVVAIASAGKKKARVFLDVILLAHGRAMTKLLFSSLRTPFAHNFELNLVNAAAEQLGR